MKHWKQLLLLAFLFCLSMLQAAETSAKYVILLIGDGMGPTIRQFYQHEYPATVLEKFPVTVQTGTNNVFGKCTDSAASGTAIACGIKTYNSSIGMDKDKRPVVSLAKKLRDRGYSIGVITSVGLNDATPAAHYANRETRKEKAGIIEDLCKSNFDFFAGGALALPPKVTLADCGKQLKNSGYELLTKFQPNGTNPDKRVVYITSMAPDWPADKVAKGHVLSDFTAFAAESLSKNPKGFFLVVEGGAIDSGGHTNDLARTMREMVEFDKAVQSALAFQKKHPKETLIVITSDHDTGGMNIAENLPQDTTLWKKQLRSAQLIEKNFAKIFPKSSDEELIQFLSRELAMGELTAAEKTAMKQALKDQRDPEIAGKKKKLFRSMYGYYNPVVIQMLRLRDARCGISWTTFSHTPRKVLTNAQGPGQDFFKAVRENSDIPRNISMAMLGENILPPAEKAAAAE